MKRNVIVLLALLCFLTGCSASKNTDRHSSENLDELFENQPAENEVGSVSFALSDPIDTVYTYNGQPLRIPFNITGTAAGSVSEVGLLLFVDGIAQPYAAVHEDATELPEAYMQVFQLGYDEQESFDMVFQPVTGKTGETVSIMAVTILKPSFIPKNEGSPNYGFYHSDSATVSRHIQFDVDAPAQTMAAQSTNYAVKELPKDIIDRLSAWGNLDALDTTAELEFCVDEGNVIRADGKSATVTVRLYGGPEANFHITMFINHQPVKVNGADVISVKTEKDKMVECFCQIDTADYGELNTLYAIAVTAGADDALEINNPIKTSSILLVNKENQTNENKTTQNDFLMPEYDYSTNTLNISDLSLGTVTASYSFENEQMPMLVEKMGSGVVMLSSEESAKTQYVGDVVIASEDSSATALWVWQFDSELRLQNRYELKNEELVGGLQGDVFSVSPDGKEIMYAIGDSLYRYLFESQSLKKVSVALSDHVFYRAIHYSNSGKYLAFYGDLVGKDGTAYGAVDLAGGNGKVFFADGFTAATLSVNGEYAAIADTVLPAGMGGPAQTGSVLYIDLTAQQGKRINVENGEESGLVAVSNDGRYVVTCRRSDSNGGVLSVYQTNNSTKLKTQDYSLGMSCKPYMVYITDSFAYAALTTENGNTISSQVVFP